MEGVERSPRRTGKKTKARETEEEEVDPLEVCYYIYEFLFSFSKPAATQVNLNPFVPVVILASFITVVFVPAAPVIPIVRPPSRP